MYLVEERERGSNLCDKDIQPTTYDEVREIILALRNDCYDDIPVKIYQTSLTT